MSGTKTHAVGINRRSLLGAASIGWMVSASPSFGASPNPYFFDPRLLVLDYSAESESSQLWPFISKDEVLPQLASYIEEEFARSGVEVPLVLRQASSSRPADVNENAVLYVTVRIDLSKTHVDDNEGEMVVGAISLQLSRAGITRWSEGAYELFVVPFRSELVHSAILASARAHLDKALIKPLAANLHQ